jgi:hypothetical protein
MKEISRYSSSSGKSFSGNGRSGASHAALICALALHGSVTLGCGSSSTSTTATSTSSSMPSSALAGGAGGSTGGSPQGPSGGHAGNGGGTAGVAGSPGAAGAARDASAPGALRIPHDWNGIVGTGQSLSVGEPGGARNMPDGLAQLTGPSFNNLQLSTGSLPWPVDANDPTLSMVPLREPIGRRAPTYPSSWPTNIADSDTPHSPMANQLTTAVQAATGADFVSVHGAVGENGQCLSFLVKGATISGVNGHAYEATLVETRAITRLAAAAGKSYGVEAIIVTHGECDAGNAQYADQLYALWTDYSVDLPAITGQAEPPLMIVSQQNTSGERSASTLAAWRIGVDHPDNVVCSGPKYQYPYTSDNLHLISDGYIQLGEKYAQVFYERVLLGNDWRPLEPTSASREGRVVTVNFHVPVPPLAWEESFQEPHQTTLTEWSAGRGFELRDGASAPIAISSVEIDADAVHITSAVDLPATLTVGYAMSGDATEKMTTPFAGAVHWGRLRDSDPFVGATSQKAQPNFAVSFELPVP